MSELLREALLDAKKLREAAEMEAKASIIDALAPQIRKIMMQEIATISGPEIEEDSTGLLFPTPQEAESPSEGSGGGSVSASPAPSPGGSGLPVAVQGAEAGLGMALPDNDGKLVVDFEALFAPVGPEEVDTNSPPPELPGTVGAASAVPPTDLTQAPVGDVALPAPTVTPPPPPGTDLGTSPATTKDVPPPPLPTGDGGVGPAATPEEEQVNKTPMTALESWHRDLMAIKESVDKVCARTSPLPEVAQGSLRERMFRSYETLEGLVRDGLVDEKNQRLQEQRLDFLFRVLKEAENGSIYGADKDTQKKMTSLAEIQKALFSEGASGFDEPVTHKFTPGDSVSTGTTGLPVDQEKTDHAEKVSGVAPGVDLFEESLDKALQEMVDVLMREECSGTKSGGSKSKAGATARRLADLPENTVLEIDEAELKEAIVALRKENLKRQIKSIRESAAAQGDLDTKTAPEKPWEEATEPEGGADPSHANLKEEADDLGGDLGGGGDDSGGGSMMGEESEFDMPLDLALTLNIDNVDTLEIVADEETLKSLGSTVGGADLDAPEEGDDSLEILDDTDTDTGTDAGADVLGVSDDGAEDDDVGVASSVEGDTEEDEEETKLPMTTTEGKKQKQVKATTKTRTQPLSESAQLKAQLAEQSLFTAKVVFLNKFLQMEGLSKKQQVRIADLLDKARNSAELKETYKKIKTVLKENANRATTASAGQKVGQGSVVSPGATSSQSVVNESVSQTSTSKDESAGKATTLNEGYAIPAEMAGATLDFDRWMKALRLPKKGD